MKSKGSYYFLMVMIVVFSIFLSTSKITLGASMEGVGTETSPYLIRTADDLYSIAQKPTAHYKLMNDLNLENVERAPMVEFRGILDGNNCIIKNLNISNDNNNIGLFRVAEDCSISNLILEDVIIKGTKIMLVQLQATLEIVRFATSL